MTIGILAGVYENLSHLRNLAPYSMTSDPTTRRFSVIIPFNSHVPHQGW